MYIFINMIRKNIYIRRKEIIFSKEKRFRNCNYLEEIKRFFTYVFYNLTRIRK